jgi:hypothetical protein
LNEIWREKKTNCASRGSRCAVDNWKYIIKITFSNCHIIGLDSGSLVLIVFVKQQLKANANESFHEFASCF